MMDRCRYLFSTIGRKQMMALAGLAWCGFVLVHASGNLLMFKGAQAYNIYGHAIMSNPFIYVAEAGLVATILFHAVSGILLTIRNRSARPQGYAKHASGDKATSYATRTMPIQGVVILAFIIIHLITFKYGPHYEATYGGKAVRDLFRLVYEVFQNPFKVGGYILALLILCFHLSHGLYSALQTMGLHHPKYSPTLKCASVFYGAFVSFAFISQPIYMFFFYKV